MTSEYLSGTTAAEDVIAPADALRPSPSIRIWCYPVIPDPMWEWPEYQQLITDLGNMAPATCRCGCSDC